MSVAVCEARMAAMNSRISSFLKSFDNGITSVLERSHHQTITRWEDSMKAIEAANLRKTYPGGVRALDGLSLAVEAGTIFGLLFFFGCCGSPRDLHSFPTRRSSD